MSEKGYVKLSIPKNCATCELLGNKRKERFGCDTLYCRGVDSKESGQSNKLFNYPAKPVWCPFISEEGKFNQGEVLAKFELLSLLSNEDIAEIKSVIFLAVDALQMQIKLKNWCREHEDDTNSCFSTDIKGLKEILSQFIVNKDDE